VCLFVCVCVCVCVLYVHLNKTVICHLNNYKLLFHILKEKYNFESKSVIMKMAKWNINVKQSQLSKLKGPERKSCIPNDTGDEINIRRWIF
jgi:hypothetical protein